MYGRRPTYSLLLKPSIVFSSLPSRIAELLEDSFMLQLQASPRI